MAQDRSFKLLPLEYFSFGNSFSGSRGDFNYKLVPKDGQLELLVWYGKLCSAKSPAAAQAQLPLSEEGRLAAQDWLAEQYELFRQEQLRAYLQEGR